MAYGSPCALGGQRQWLRDMLDTVPRCMDWGPSEVLLEDPTASVTEPNRPHLASIALPRHMCVSPKLATPDSPTPGGLWLAPSIDPQKTEGELNERVSPDRNAQE